MKQIENENFEFVKFSKYINDWLLTVFHFPFKKISVITSFRIKEALLKRLSILIKKTIKKNNDYLFMTNYCV